MKINKSKKDTEFEKQYFLGFAESFVQTKSTEQSVKMSVDRIIEAPDFSQSGRFSVFAYGEYWTVVLMENVIKNFNITIQNINKTRQIDGSEIRL